MVKKLGSEEKEKVVEQTVLTVDTLTITMKVLMMNLEKVSKT